MNSIGKPIAVSTIWKPSGMQLPMYYTLLWSIIESLDKAADELQSTMKALDELEIVKGC